ncbi:MAG: class IV adenylate cyclase [Planctomycetes bacterium]|nr:class IV adenylate cyclase [Planctomycetota bacterium]
MQFEVEQKHRIDDVAGFEAMLANRGVTLGSPVEQADQYFAHPARDFAKTDEALRIRTARGKSFVTYKGPKLDAATKTRRELELPLDATDAGGLQFAELLSALGFKPVAVVRKNRRLFHLVHDGREVEGALDDVDGVGTFVELELLAEDANLDETKQVIAALAADLNLGPSERRSYLELLLAK